MFYYLIFFPFQQILINFFVTLYCRSNFIFCYFIKTIMTNTEKESKQAKRALDEAKKRRSKTDNNYNKMPAEKKGRGGLEPTRYGDWEVKGIASDF